MLLGGKNKIFVFFLLSEKLLVNHFVSACKKFIISTISLCIILNTQILFLSAD